MLEKCQRIAETLNKRFYQLINVGLNQEVAANNVAGLANRLTYGKSLSELHAIAFCYNRLDISLQRTCKLRNKKLLSSQLMVFDQSFKIRIVEPDRIRPSANSHINSLDAVNALAPPGPVSKRKLCSG